MNIITKAKITTPNNRMMSQKTPLYQSHIDLDADMVDFAGYLMPVRYKTSIIDEHRAVREKVGMFDVSHMGRYWISGNDAKEFLNLMVPRNIMKLTDGTAGYTFMLNENGGFRDDVIISQMTDEEFMLVCNAGNRQKIWNWINAFSLFYINAGKNILIEDKSNSSYMIAVQGPKAISTLELLFSTKLPNKRFRTKWIKYENNSLLFSSTGYTGASGGEIIFFGTQETIDIQAKNMWKKLLELGVTPCALGSRDTLRLEAGYRLYGNDLSEDLLLTESGLNFYPFVDLDKEPGFIGKQAVVSQSSDVKKTVVGFKLDGRGIPRHGQKIFINDNECGEVLSGTQSPMTKEPFGLALVPLELKNVGSKFLIEMRNKRIQAHVINLPLYNENEYGLSVNE